MSTAPDQTHHHDHFVDPHARPPVTKGWIGRYGLAYLGINLAWAGPSQLLIAKQVLDFFGDNGKEQYLALIMAVGGAASIIATALWGFVTDWTRSRFGRRSPWVLIGAVTSAALLVWMGGASSFVSLLIAWTLFQIMIASAVGASQAMAPDRVPTNQYGTVSGVMGLTYTLALVLGTAIGTVFDVAPAYWISAAVVVVLVVQFLVFYREVPTGEGVFSISPTTPAATDDSDEDVKKPVGAQANADRPYADFIWVFIARMAVTLGNVTALFYLFYYLRDRIKLDDPDTGVLILTGIYALAVVVCAVAAGSISDKMHRRLIFVAGSSVGVAAACLIMAWAHAFWVVIIAALVLGISWGVYMAVDQALINEVLPIPAQRGRDVGIMNIAVVTPNALAPVVAAGALSFLGGYAGLYILSGVLALTGALVIYRVRNVA